MFWMYTVGDKFRGLSREGYGKRGVVRFGMLYLEFKNRLGVRCVSVKTETYLVKRSREVE